ncbi:phenylalanine--tRNA ligase, putative [Plasmodium malariae]|uniref:phenylalanine--tRNA ligase n=1 Tax=Plasmodium malariae TaxID=5858 RepID=A0A1C3L013_PLAMA|nr:phenylalanine--tRNA ligase, putative [Plasmodium malariae]
MTLPKLVLSNQGKILYDIVNHPIRTIKNKIENFFKFENIDNLNSEISVKQNFDELLVPLTHSARNIKDTFYLNEHYIKNFSFYFQNYYTPFDNINSIYKYYLANKLLYHDKIKLKRTHMTAHLPDLLRQNYKNVIYTGAVYRKDEIDKYHFPIFHQTDGYLIQPKSFNAESDLKKKLEKLISYLFSSKKIEMKWDNNTTFPFTEPSYELYIRARGVATPDMSIDVSTNSSSDDSFDGSTNRSSGSSGNNKWIEVLGCGKIKKEVIAICLYEKDLNQIIENEIAMFDKNLMKIIDKCNDVKNIEECSCVEERASSIINNLCKKHLSDRIEKKIYEFIKDINHEGWAFGIGLERLAMLLYDIYDIRLLWSNDKRFISQFKENEISSFRPFSNFPSIIKDVTFYINDSFNETLFFQICRDIAHENIEEVKKIDHYYNPHTNKASVCYRITYRSHKQNLTHKSVNDIQNKVIQKLIKECSVVIR